MMSFSEALIYLRNGKHLCRAGWHGKGLSVYVYEPDSDTLSNDQLEANTHVNRHFRIWDRRLKSIDSWVPSVSDCLNFDWMFYEEEDE